MREYAARTVLDAVAANASAQIGGENFPVALRVLPRGPRDALARVYVFARFVDDVGDEAPGGADEKLMLLDEVEAHLRAEWDGTPSRLAPVRGLGALIAAHDMPIEPFLDLVEANRVDQRVGRYESFADLIGYCRYSAAPVGRIVLRLADADTPANVACSDDVCDALQVLEHCQDVAEDARRDRVYLPGEELRAAGLDVADLIGTATPTAAPTTAPTAAVTTTSPALRRVVAAQVARADGLLDSGRPLVGSLRGWARLAVAGFLAGGQATSHALRAADYDVLARTIRPTKIRTAGLLTLRLIGR